MKNININKNIHHNHNLIQQTPKNPIPQKNMANQNNDIQALNEHYINSFYKESSSQNYAVLKLAVTDPNLVEHYANYIESHNAALFTTEFTNAGFDLIVPEDTFVGAIKMINLGVKAEMISCVKSVSGLIRINQGKHLLQEGEEEGISYNTGFYMYPRSSIAKTPLMMANHVGVIDSGYRGNLIAAVRCLEQGHLYLIEKGTRLFQICHPSLCPVFVVMVPEEELSCTERGEGGFGSTGTK